MRLKRLTGAWIAVILIALVCCAGASAATPKAAIVLNKTAVTMGLVAGVNDELQLTATIKNNKMGLLPENIVWSSGNEAVATIVQGKIKAVGLGTCRVYAKLDGAKTDSVLVRVRKINPSSLSVTPTKRTLYVGRNGQGATTVGLVGKIKPANADIQKIVWTSSNTAVATVDESTGLVTPVAPGKCKILGTVEGTKVRKSMAITVKGIVPTGVGFTETQLHITPGGKATLAPIIEPSYAWNQDVVYASANKKVATVSADGVVTGVRVGTTRISVKTKSGARVGRIDVVVDLSQTTISYLAIGQEAYRAGRLNGTLTDARSFAATLTAGSFGQKGAIVGSVEANLSRTQILAALDNAASGKTENDITYIFYSGHGMGGSSAPVRERGAMVGVDMQPVYVDEVKTLLDKIPGTVVFVIDACFSGQYLQAKGANADAVASPAEMRAFTNAIVGEFASNPVVTKSVTRKGTTTLIATDSRDKYRIIVACRPTQESYMMGDGTPSFMTRFVTEAGGAIWDEANYTFGNMKGDANKDGWLTLAEVYKYAYTRVMRLAASGRAIQNMSVWPTSSQHPIFARQ